MRKVNPIIGQRMRRGGCARVVVVSGDGIQESERSSAHESLNDGRGGHRAAITRGG